MDRDAARAHRLDEERIPTRVLNTIIREHSARARRARRLLDASGCVEGIIIMASTRSREDGSRGRRRVTAARSRAQRSVKEAFERVEPWTTDDEYYRK